MFYCNNTRNRDFFSLYCHTRGNIAANIRIIPEMAKKIEEKILFFLLKKFKKKKGKGCRIRKFDTVFVDSGLIYAVGTGTGPCPDSG